MKALVAGLVVLVLLLTAIAAFLWSGSYNVAANVPHWEVTSALLEKVRERSVQMHSRDITPPPLNDPGLMKTGFEEYHYMCRYCHGAPGRPRAGFAMGLYPSPPDLTSGSVQKRMSDAQIFWVVRNGLKMTGMPAFETTHEDQDIWSIVAFVKRLPELKSEEYNTMAGALPQEEAEHGH